MIGYSSALLTGFGGLGEIHGMQMFQNLFQKMNKRIGADSK